MKDLLQRFCFGGFELLVRERLLLRDGMRIGIGSRAFDLLLALVERAGETVNRQDLFDRVWPDVIVAKVNLRVHVAGLRKALDDGRDGNRYIISVANRGYRFVAAVNRVRSASLPMRGPEMCVVDLADVDDPAHVVVAVAAALGCNATSHEQAFNRVIDRVYDQRMLLAFDNCEHAIAGVTRLMERLLPEAPWVQFLVNGRSSLRLG